MSVKQSLVWNHQDSGFAGTFPCLLASRGCSRRAILGGLATLAIWSRSVPNGLLPSDLLAATAKTGSEEPWTRVRSIVELSGEVHLKDEMAVMKGATKTATVQSTSTVDYEEQVASTAGKGDGLVSFLRVHEAKIESRINKVAIVDQLRPECRNMARVTYEGEVYTNSIQEPLLPKERDMVDGAISSSFVDELLPLASVQIGQSWEPSKDTLCRVFHLDAVHTSTVRVRLVDADETTGKLEFQGKMEAAVQGVGTSLVVEGKGQVDRKRGLMTWLAVKFDEHREIGESKPGFKITAKVRLLRAPNESPTDPLGLESVPNEYVTSDQIRYLRFQSKLGGFQFLASDRWHVIKDSPNQTVLRLVERNQSMCQANISSLPDFEAGRQMTLEGFQVEVKRALGAQFGESIEGTERLSATGLRLLRCVSIGEVNGVGIYWIHTLLSDDAGRRQTVTFTMDRGLAETFAGNDEQIINSFRFQARPLTSPSPTLPQAGAGQVESAQGPLGPVRK